MVDPAGRGLADGRAFLPCWVPGAPASVLCVRGDERLHRVDFGSSLLAGPSRPQAEGTKASPAAKTAGDTDKAILSLSGEKWTWMLERKVDSLAALFHEGAVFVHMGGAMSRAQELAVIRSGSIQYERADIQEASVRIIGATAIVLKRIRLLAVVGGNEVTHPFMVTEVYVQQVGKWKLAQLSFTRLLGS